MYKIVEMIRQILSYGKTEDFCKVLKNFFVLAIIHFNHVRGRRIKAYPI